MSQNVYMSVEHLQPAIPKFVWDLGALIDKQIKDALVEQNNRLHNLVCKRCKKRFKKLKP